MKTWWLYCLAAATACFDCWDTGVVSDTTAACVEDWFGMEIFTETGDEELRFVVYFREDTIEATARDVALHRWGGDGGLAREAAGRMRDRVAGGAPFRLRCANESDDRVFADFFVEVGASNLFPLHEQLFQRSDWGGLAVEPLDFARRQLPSRPGLRAEGAALGCPRGAATTPFYAVDAEHLHSGAVPAYALGAASIEPGGPFAAWASETRVPCATWADVAARHGLAPCGDQAITLVKVDAEGRDAAIVGEILDWYDAAACDRRPPRVRYEDHDGASVALRGRLEGAGYDCRRDEAVGDVDCMSREKGADYARWASQWPPD